MTRRIRTLLSRWVISRQAFDDLVRRFRERSDALDKSQRKHAEAEAAIRDCEAKIKRMREDAERTSKAHDAECKRLTEEHAKFARKFFHVEPLNHKHPRCVMLNISISTAVVGTNAEREYMARIVGHDVQRKIRDLVVTDQVWRMPVCEPFSFEVDTKEFPR